MEKPEVLVILFIGSHMQMGSVAQVLSLGGRTQKERTDSEHQNVL